MSDSENRRIAIDRQIVALKAFLMLDSATFSDLNELSPLGQLVFLQMMADDKFMDEARARLQELGEPHVPPTSNTDAANRPAETRKTQTRH
ncbi:MULTISPECIES: hypothetical protein [unclassified Bradyrhizobium]|uniref:hypothetical protein n=1 Tax=unclassified Bradyrhizobium TaxID=2631580 RepID=UPI001FFA6B73|nr:MULTISPECIES: hypothetical protein [unclassified Bradyrhizobium]MCK1466608.1 hypothetical protein [Bradyrhizobium sp. CW10]UPK23398.1 hypothetical protein IVA73_37950 [Bradyrhizobium sp. 131]